MVLVKGTIAGLQTENANVSNPIVTWKNHLEIKKKNFLNPDFLIKRFLENAFCLRYTEFKVFNKILKISVPAQFKKGSATLHDNQSENEHTELEFLKLRKN